MNKLTISWSAVAFLWFLTLNLSASQISLSTQEIPTQQPEPANNHIQTGADQLDRYLPLLKGKRVGLMGNQTSVVGKDLQHLVDVLFKEKIDLRFAFAPEHGFRGETERGEKVSNEVDEKTGLPLYSLYGKNDKQDSIIKSIDIMIFDLQDVGSRYYTYVASLHRVMELCALHEKPLLVLDRPNPCGDQIDGPIRNDDKFKANISYHQIPIMHGLTIGELARMINGEGWLKEGRICELTVIPNLNYHHQMSYPLPVIPSPSLPNHLSVRLYGSLCLFEGTNISEGRGTDWPFQVIGYPDPVFGDFEFTPGSKAGMEKHVAGRGNVNYGLDLRNLNPDEQKFTLKYVIDFYNKMPDKSKFFTRPDFFDKLAGTDELRKQIIAGKSESEIRATWENDLKSYRKMRSKYLLYADSI